jgi:hypothetical protein
VEGLLFASAGSNHEAAYHRRVWDRPDGYLSIIFISLAAHRKSYCQITPVANLEVLAFLGPLLTLLNKIGIGF